MGALPLSASSGGPAHPVPLAPVKWAVAPVSWGPDEPAFLEDKATQTPPSPASDYSYFEIR